MAGVMSLVQIAQAPEKFLVLLGHSVQNSVQRSDVFRSAVEEKAMPIKVLELHHHGIRMGTSEEAVQKARQFYTEVLGLQSDPGRPNIRGIPGFWLYVGDAAQIHLMGAEGRSPV